MKKLLITGADGFIGRALCCRLAFGNELIGVDITKGLDKSANIDWEQVDLTDWESVPAICEKHSPDVVIHCAGIAHQKIGMVDLFSYLNVNSEATENLAKSASRANPDVSFIFLSSVSVYGESPHPRGMASGFHPDGITEKSRVHWAGRAVNSQNDDAFDEESECNPSSDYAVSKLDAEMRLIALFDSGIIRNLIILRLAPVYDREWSFNLDRRIFAPGKLAYLRFGSGLQKMSALARPNLVDFIEFLVHEYGCVSQVNGGKNSLGNRRNLRINICDAEPYEFNRIIRVFKKSGIRPNRTVISVPLSVVWFATRIAGVFFSNKKGWIHSCYDKLACGLVFDNGRMMGTGFRPRHSLETILSADYADCRRL